jgi:ferredoxin-NADP reductase
MAGTAVHGRLNWHAATVAGKRKETETATTIVLDVVDWPGHTAGQHVDVRLRAADGYTAVRTYSIANAPSTSRVELTIELMPDGEVSPYLVDAIALGDPLEILGPIGGWFTWRPEQVEPIQLIAGGSGIVPLMAMIRAREQAGVHPRFSLLYSVRTPETVIYRDELDRIESKNDGISIALAYTRKAPANWTSPPGRIDAKIIGETVLAAREGTLAYICGSNAFVETASQLLIGAGYDAGRIKTERFGPTGTMG